VLLWRRKRCRTDVVRVLKCVTHAAVGAPTVLSHQGVIGWPWFQRLHLQCPSGATKSCWVTMVAVTCKKLVHHVAWCRLYQQGRPQHPLVEECGRVAPERLVTLSLPHQ
jgi:hypothetical protein